MPDEPTSPSRLFSEILYQSGDMDGIVVAFITKDGKESFRYHGSRVLCRGLAEELCDFLTDEFHSASDEEDEEEEQGGTE